MKQRIKKALKHPKVHQALAWLGSGYIRLVLSTSKVELHVAQESQPYFDGEQPAIFALWHSRIMLIQCNIPKKRPMHVMVSSHSDGRMIADILAHFDVVPVHGSTSKEGAKALKQMVRDFRAGKNVSITPDGPRGPARQVKEQGVAQLAMLTQAPIICVSYAATRHKRLNSWDRFVIPLPFSQIYFVAEAPLHFTADAALDKAQNREKLCATIEDGINRVTDKSDMLAGAS